MLHNVGCLWYISAYKWLFRSLEDLLESLMLLDSLPQLCVLSYPWQAPGSAFAMAPA